MSAEKIIERIKKDAEKEIKQITKEAEKQAKTVIDAAKKDAEEEAEKIINDGLVQSENIKKIMISKANQDVKRNILNAKENIIDDCFQKASQQLSELRSEDYIDLVTKMITGGKSKIGGPFTIIVSRDMDRELAGKHGVTVKGTTQASGGIILESENGKITVDNTFEGILERKKDEIRMEVGKILFSR